MIRKKILKLRFIYKLISPDMSTDNNNNLNSLRYELLKLKKIQLQIRTQTPDTKLLLSILNIQEQFTKRLENYMTHLDSEPKTPDVLTPVSEEKSAFLEESVKKVLAKQEQISAQNELTTTQIKKAIEISADKQVAATTKNEKKITALVSQSASKISTLIDSNAADNSKTLIKIEARIKTLLDKYENILISLENINTSVKAINYGQKIEQIEKKIEFLFFEQKTVTAKNITLIEKFHDSIEKKIETIGNEIKTTIVSKNDSCNEIEEKQDKKLNNISNMLYITMILIVLGTALSIIF